MKLLPPCRYVPCSAGVRCLGGGESLPQRWIGRGVTDQLRGPEITGLDPIGLLFVELHQNERLVNADDQR